jgi:hypothetical protein
VSPRAEEQIVVDAVDRPVFIGGCPRSGTTLLGAMLHAHPALAIPPETRFFLEAYREQRAFGDLREVENRRAVARWITGRKKSRFRQLQLPTRATTRAIVAAPPTIGSLSCTVFSEFAAAHGAQRWGDKRPYLVEQLPAVFRLVPDAQFIHIVRDARGCTASLKKLGWWGWGAPEALYRWRSSVLAGLRARRTYRPDQYIELRYEDLVADTESQLRRLCDWLQIEFVADMLRHEDTASLISKPYHHRLSQPVDTTAVQAWRNELDPEELALVEREVGDLLDEFGYERLTGLPGVPREMGRRYAAWARRRRLGQLRDRGSDVLANLRPQPQVAAQLTSVQRALARGANAV